MIKGNYNNIHNSEEKGDRNIFCGRNTSCPRTEVFQVDTIKWYENQRNDGKDRLIGSYKLSVVSTRTTFGLRLTNLFKYCAKILGFCKHQDPLEERCPRRRPLTLLCLWVPWSMRAASICSYALWGSLLPALETFPSPGPRHNIAHELEVLLAPYKFCI